MSALVIFWLTLFGLAEVIPSPGTNRNGWLGARMFAGFAILVLSTFIAQMPFGVPLATAAWIISGVAAAGCVRKVLRPSGIDPFHPIFLLSLAVAAIVMIRGGISYEPLAWDELSNWLIWSRQAVDVGYFNSPSISNMVLGYPPGWPIALAFPNLLWGSFDASRCTAMFVLIHIAALGLVYDVLMAKLSLAGWSLKSARLGSWCVLLMALTVEATWKLVPTNLLIEEPQTYCLIACVLLTLAAIDKDTSLPRTGGLVGVIFSVSYLIKVSMLAFSLPLLILWAVPTTLRLRNRWQQALLGLVALGLPILVVYGVWTVFGPPQGCLSNPLSVIHDFMNDSASADRALDLWHRFSAAELDYIQTYKYPLTVLAGLGLVTAFFSRHLAMVPIALTVYCVLYFGALYIYHLDCFGDYYFKTLNSIDRFTRVPLRLIHLCGLVLPVLALAHCVAAKAGQRGGMIAMALIIVVLGGWQLRQINASFTSTATRIDSTDQQVGAVRSIRRDSLDLIKLIQETGPENGRQVLQIKQGGDGYEFFIGRYYGLGHFNLVLSWSWGDPPINVWMRQSQPVEMKEALLSASLVWPVKIDGWMLSVLQDMVHSPECLANVTDYFLIPAPETAELKCVKKTQAAN